MGKAKKEIEFYQLEGALEDSYVVKNNVTYFINGFTKEFVEKINTTYVSVTSKGGFSIYGKENNNIEVSHKDKLKKIVFDSEKNSITVKDKKNNKYSETYEVGDFTEMYESIPVLLSEQGVYKFKKRKYGNKLTLNFE